MPWKTKAKQIVRKTVKYMLPYGLVKGYKRSVPKVRAAHQRASVFVSRVGKTVKSAKKKWRKTGVVIGPQLPG